MPKKLKPYVPTQEALDWAQARINFSKDGTIIGTSHGQYRVDKTRKAIVLINPADLQTDFTAFVWHHHHHYTWAKLGWTVEPVIDWENIEVPDNIPDE